MVEFAMAIGIFLLVVFGVIEFSYFFYVYSTVFSSVREATRYASAVGVNEAGVAREKDCNSIRLSAMRIGGIVGVNATSVDIRYDHGPTDTRAWDELPTCESNPATELGDRVVIKIGVPYKSLTGIIPDLTVRNVEARTIVKGVDVAGNFPTAIPVVYTNTPIGPTETAGPPTATLTATETATATITETPSNTPTITLTRQFTDTPTATFTATATYTPTVPTATPTFTFTPTKTFTPTPEPCSVLVFRNVNWDNGNNKYSVELVNNSASSNALILTMSALWTASKTTNLESIYFGGSRLWAGLAGTPFQVGGSSSNQWIAGADRSLLAGGANAKTLTLDFPNGGGGMDQPALVINLQLGSDDDHVCVLKP